MMMNSDHTTLDPTPCGITEMFKIRQWLEAFIWQSNRSSFIAAYLPTFARLVLGCWQEVIRDHYRRWQPHFT